ncbi:MAG: VWA domain-containing protein, partial [Pseudomonadota bacterium]
LVPRVIEFTRLLRDNGFQVSAEDVADATRFFSESAGVPAERRVRATLKVLSCTRASELSRFDELFDAYWNHRVGRKRTILRHSRTGTMTAGVKKEGAGSGARGGLAAYFEWGDKNDDGDAEEAPASRMGGASVTTSSSRIDFGKSSDPEEMARLMELADRLGARMRFRLARRRKVSSHGRQLNLRRTLRRSVATGGLPIALVRRVRREPPLRLVLFIDVSGSMDAYSIFFMRFIHALTGRFQSAEAFLFHTRLVHISGALREADPIKMMEKVSLISQGWSGGTRIGEALETFNRLYAEAFGGSRTVAIIMSDGYDTGPPERMAAAVKALSQRTHKVLWLNPMAGRTGYEPATDAMAAALPHLDLFAPAHNLESLSALENSLVRA